MCAYAPGVTDISGQLFGQGILGAMQSLSMGLSDYRKKKEKADQDAAAAKWIEANVVKLGLDLKTDDPGEIKALIKTAGGGPQAVQTLQGMAQMKLQQQAVDNAARESEIRAREMEARIAQSQGQIADVAAKRANQDQGAKALSSTLSNVAQDPAEFARLGGYVRANGQQPTIGITGETLRRYAEKAGAGIDPEVVKLIATMQPKPAKPLPGSLGTSMENVPGIGTIVRDVATGSTIPAADIQKADKPAKPEKPTEAEVAFETNVKLAKENLAKLRGVVEKYGTYENAYIGNPKAAALLDQLPYQIAIQTAKIVDPSSVAREGEVAAAQKYMLKLGMFANKESALAALDNLQGTFGSYERERGQVQRKPAAGTSPDASAAAPAASASAADKFTDGDGAMYPIVTVRGQRGVIKGGKFYPIVE